LRSVAKEIARKRCVILRLYHRDGSAALGGVSTLDASAPLAPYGWHSRLRAIADWIWSHLVPRRVRRFLAARFYGVARGELWGYVVWSAVGLAIAAPELAAAVGGDGSRWRTISTTTGHLEDVWPTFGIVPVALIAILAYGALRFPYKGEVKSVQPFFKAGPRGAVGMPTGLTGVARSEYGRPIRGDYDPATGSVDGRRRVVPIRWYFPLSVAVVAGASLAASRLDDPWALEYVMYGLIALFGIAIPTVLSYLHTDVPYYNALFTLRALDRRLHLVGYVIAAGLGILFVHLAFYPWPDFGRTHAVWAGSSPGRAQELAERTVAEVRGELEPLKVLTRDRIVTGRHQEAWRFYFETAAGSPSACMVLVQHHSGTATACDR
jgi:hypothetical protein